MKATVRVTLDDGSVLEGMTELRSSPDSAAAKTQDRRHAARPKQTSNGRVDYNLPVRPFMKKYGRGRTGAEKLTILTARLAAGKSGTAVQRPAVVRQWNKMAAIMGGKYNGAYDTRARDAGWIDSPKPGLFALREGWEDVLQ